MSPMCSARRSTTAGTTIPLLERTAGQHRSLLMLGEEPAGYWAEDEDWRQELMELDA